ncbi:hypothetical protein BH10PSE16_BH10PSE16_24320 [soil metagenome]
MRSAGTAETGQCAGAVPGVAARASAPSLASSQPLPRASAAAGLSTTLIATGHGADYSLAMHMTHFSWRLVQLALLASALALGTGAGAQPLPPAPPSVQPDSGPWDSGAGFDFDLGKKKLKKTRQSVSGMACNLDARRQRICLMAFDEGVQARYARLGDNALIPDAEPVALRAGSGELDAEGAATDGRYFYVTGSHSAKRGDCASNLESRHVLRLAVDPATGRAARTAGGGALAGYADSGRLWSIRQAHPALAPYVGEGKCLGADPRPDAPALAGQQGVNIEGLAVQGGRLYFGFRGPSFKDAALVLAVDTDALFDAQATRDPKASVTRLALGRNRGIRDMVAVTGGLLLLAGPDDSRANQDAGWVVAWWDGQSAPDRVVQPKILAALDLGGVKLRKCDKELKPEAMTVLEETPAAYKLLILSDGLCDGGPLAFTLAR